MPTERLVNKNQKQMVLACFKARIASRVISKELDIPLTKILHWEQLYQQGNRNWARESDKALVFRQQAYKLFSEGFGYKRVASKLQLPLSRVKYWHLLFVNNMDDFFQRGNKKRRGYSEEDKRILLEKFLKSSLSKKRFSVQNGISLSTLNRWLGS